LFLAVFIEFTDVQLFPSYSSVAAEKVDLAYHQKLMLLFVVPAPPKPYLAVIKLLDVQLVPSYSSVAAYER
jgi:hypothetical protein